MLVTNVPTMKILFKVCSFALIFAIVCKRKTRHCSQSPLLLLPTVIQGDTTDRPEQHDSSSVPILNTEYKILSNTVVSTHYRQTQICSYFQAEILHLVPLNIVKVFTNATLVHSNRTQVSVQRSLHILHSCTGTEAFVYILDVTYTCLAHALPSK